MIVGAVTDDIRVQEVPCMKITALRFTKKARARIEKAGGECLTFDQLALKAPLGQNTVFIFNHISFILFRIPFSLTQVSLYSFVCLFYII